MKQKNKGLADDLRVIRFSCGRYENFWIKNVVGIGNASGFVEPLEATALHLIAEQIATFCGSLLDADLQIVPAGQNVDNEQFRRAWDEVRDFLALHYKFNRSLDTPFWRHCQAHTDLGGAEQLVELYQQLGPHRSLDSLISKVNMFGFEGYLALLIGQQLPMEYKFQLSEEDRQDWAQYRAGVRADIQDALPVRESLQKMWPQ